MSAVLYAEEFKPSIWKYSPIALMNTFPPAEAPVYPEEAEVVLISAVPE